METTLDNVIDFLGERFDDLTTLITGIPNAFVYTLDFVFDTLSNFVGVVLGWLYNFLFIDIWSTCRSYGIRILNFFFDSFASESFSFSAIEYIIGFIFVVFAIKFTMRIIRG